MQVTKDSLSMQKHVENYYKAFGYDESSQISCEYCGKRLAVDIHHVLPRSSFGSKRKDEQDATTNLIALCRVCHNRAHGFDTRYLREKFKQIIEDR
jgi:5-methylcytosine-specific restriction endonuclease McrA